MPSRRVWNQLSRCSGSEGPFDKANWNHILDKIAHIRREIVEDSRNRPAFVALIFKRLEPVSAWGDTNIVLGSAWSAAVMHNLRVNVTMEEVFIELLVRGVLSRRCPLSNFFPMAVKDMTIACLICSP